MKKLFSIVIVIAILISFSTTIVHAAETVGGIEFTKIASLWDTQFIGIDKDDNLWYWGSWFDSNNVIKKIDDPQKISSNIKFKDVLIGINRECYMIDMDGTLYRMYNITTGITKWDISGKKFQAIAGDKFYNVTYLALLDIDGNVWTSVQGGSIKWKSEPSKLDINAKFVSIEVSCKEEIRWGPEYLDERGDTVKIQYCDLTVTYKGIDVDGSIWQWTAKYVDIYRDDVSYLVETKPTKIGIGSASDWAKDSILEAISEGFVPEQIQDKYTNVITRGEFCDLAMKWLEYATGTSMKDWYDILYAQGKIHEVPAFDDIFSYYASESIWYAAAFGITNGTSSTKFSPNGQFTREQAATMLMRIAKFIGMDTNSQNANFADESTISDWAKDGVNFCKKHGIMNGTGNNKFSPKATYTREQAIVTLVRISIG